MQEMLSACRRCLANPDGWSVAGAMLCGANLPAQEALVACLLHGSMREIQDVPWSMARVMGIFMFYSVDKDDWHANAQLCISFA
jgi:hypothetical protein